MAGGIIGVILSFNDSHRARKKFVYVYPFGWRSIVQEKFVKIVDLIGPGKLLQGKVTLVPCRTCLKKRSDQAANDRKHNQNGKDHSCAISPDEFVGAVSDCVRARRDGFKLEVAIEVVGKSCN